MFQDYLLRGKLYYFQAPINLTLSQFYKNHQYQQQQHIFYYFHQKMVAKTSSENNLSQLFCLLLEDNSMQRKAVGSFDDSKLTALTKRKQVNIGNKFFFLKLIGIFLSHTLVFQVFCQNQATPNNQNFLNFIQIINQILDLILSNLK